jgi:energy-coupling factor transporter ATP-binding protein EcfA2
MGGALVHAASAVRNGKAYLFFGESGAGKSTLSAVNTRATIVSDDLSLVLPRDGGGLDLVGSPFRGTYEEGAPVLGRFPLAAGFRIIKAEKAAVQPVRRAIGFGQLVGNLTFVAEAFDARPDLFASVEAAFAGVPLLHLHFRKDDSYWDAIDAAGL